MTAPSPSSGKSGDVFPSPAIAYRPLDRTRPLRIGADAQRQHQVVDFMLRKGRRKDSVAAAAAYSAVGRRHRRSRSRRRAKGVRRVRGVESGEDDSECAACVTETSKGSASSPVNRIVAERGEAVRLGMAVARSVASLSLVIVIHAASQVAVHAAASVVTTRSNDSPSALNVSEEGSTLSEGGVGLSESLLFDRYRDGAGVVAAHADRSGAPCIRFIGCRGDTDGKKLPAPPPSEPCGLPSEDSTFIVSHSLGDSIFHSAVVVARFRTRVPPSASKTSVSGVTLNVGAEASGGCGS